MPAEAEVWMPAAVGAAAAATTAVALLVRPGARSQSLGIEVPAGGSGAEAVGVAADRQRALRARIRMRFATAAGAALTVLLVLPGTVGWAVAGLAAVVTWRRSGHWESRRDVLRRAAVEAGLPHVVDLMAAVLAVGAGPRDALEQVASVVDPLLADELSPYIRRLRLGSAPSEVWSELQRHPQLGRLGACLRRADDTGAPVAVALQRLGEDLRARIKAETATRVRQVETRSAVPLGVCLLPAFIALGVVPLVAGAASGLILR